MIKVPQLKKSVKHLLDIPLNVCNFTKTISHLSLGVVNDNHLDFGD